ncbi:rod shape determining protein RodA [Desulfomicrobium macestii]|uniref:Peptidoglycan glycosyltransferase RodA n=2 Tax=Desulfomicrobium TaxID=898 RepID=A0A8G2C4E4_DESNO|nr:MULTISPECIES: rod shape-determining protein RodA [Desulfomicrobium]MBE1424667.1 rod shape determining protein RodA [Desulfomicrobium macestii]SFL96355.1 cell elongation-specific peptidoglycan biosynthesis regulator RodA [Desulfomicrobium norvegicum]
MFDRRLIFHINWGLLILTALLFLVGVMNLYSASTLRLASGLEIDTYFNKQLLWGGVGLCVMTALVLIDYRHLKSVSWPYFILCLVLLLGVSVAGKTIYGAKRWLDLGFFNLQPTELTKIAVLILGARLMARMEGKLGWLNLGKALLVGLVPAVLVVKQPDLGSALNILLILGGMILFKGVTGSVFKVLVVVLPIMIPFGWFFLHDYQKQRIMTFLDPGNDPLGAGYHIIQSQIAIGSGGFWGKGFLEGTQSQLRFLPEKHTDFAFAVFGEEWGFFGSIMLLILFCSFLYQIYIVTMEAKDDFGSYLAAGVFFYFFWQILINIGMVLGIMPVVGIPLPFISYGGSASVVNFCMVGLVLNVAMRRFVFKKG